ncbi:hypothetical protein [Sanyastnella coralliicola]|uniref:hypothetical protein n=1 Tax=Sanyastnella coralliicola TaxID=3069118 RepID=UPI0027B9E94E|nr:hypothetical protein [Longitalea sp. SCSIO 12813]
MKQVKGIHQNSVVFFGSTAGSLTHLLSLFVFLCNTSCSGPTKENVCLDGVVRSFEEFSNVTNWSFEEDGESGRLRLGLESPYLIDSLTNRSILEYCFLQNSPVGENCLGMDSVHVALEFENLQGSLEFTHSMNDYFPIPEHSLMIQRNVILKILKQYPPEDILTINFLMEDLRTTYMKEDFWFDRGFLSLFIEYRLSNCDDHRLKEQIDILEYALSSPTSEFDIDISECVYDLCE